MVQQSLFDEQGAAGPPQARKPVAKIHIDKDDINADWIKWRSRESELEIHDKLAADYERKKKVSRATIEARAAVLNAQVDRATKKE